jgi:hypothetical protein
MNFRFLATKQKPITVVSALALVVVILLLASLKLLPVQPYLWLHFCLLTIGGSLTGWVCTSTWLCKHPERESRSVHVWGLVITVGFTVFGIAGLTVVRYLIF